MDDNADNEDEEKHHKLKCVVITETLAGEGFIREIDPNIPDHLNHFATILDNGIKLYRIRNKNDTDNTNNCIESKSVLLQILNSSCDEAVNTLYFMIKTPMTGDKTHRALWDSKSSNTSNNIWNGIVTLNVDFGNILNVSINAASLSNKNGCKEKIDIKLDMDWDNNNDKRVGDDLIHPEILRGWYDLRGYIGCQLIQKKIIAKYETDDWENIYRIYDCHFKPTRLMKLDDFVYRVYRARETNWCLNLQIQVE